MKNIQTLDELFERAGNHQVTAQEVLNGRTHIDGEWQAVEFSEKLKEAVICKILSSAGGWSQTQVQMGRTLRNERPQHYALARFLLCKYGVREANFTYCAGQDMTYEMKDLRNKLK